MILAYSFFVGLFVTIFAIALLARVAARLGIVDIPGPRKIHSLPIPRIGGVAIASSVIIAILLWVPIETKFGAFILGSLVIVAVGIWDDIVELNYKLKLLGQSAGIILLLVGGVHFTNLPFLGLEPVSKFISYPITFIFLLGVTNAFNLFDGLDGLAGGCIGLSIAAIALLAVAGSDALLPIICLALIGGLLGFLRFNTYPAIVFMGDAGSQFLGFAAGFLSIQLVTQVSPAISPAFPILVLGLPLLDTVSVTIRRLLQRRSPFKGDRQHLHHRLLARGLSHAQTVSVLYAIQIAVVISAHFSRFESDAVVLALFALFGLIVFAPLYAAEKSGVTFSSQKTFTLANSSARLSQRAALLAKHGPIVTACLVSTFLVAGSLFAPSASRDVALLSISVALVAALGILVLRTRRLFFYRLCAYCACAVICFLLIRGGANATVWDNWQVNLFLAGLGAVVILCLSFARSEGFQLSPQDLLMLILVVTVPNLDVTAYIQFPLGIFLLQVSLLFYAIEFALTAPIRWRISVPIAAICSLLAVAAIANF